MAHWWAGVGVWIAGTASGGFVVCVNAWMNTPAGFTLAPDGSLIDIDPMAAMLNPSSFGQVLHMTVAAFLATGWMVAGVHAWMLLRERNSAFHRRGLMLGLGVAAVFTVLQPVTGHVIAETVAHNQPVKFAALEGLWETQTRAPFTIGGWPDEVAEETRYSIEIPGLLSIMAFGDIDAEVMGLSDVPVEDRPPVLVTHLAYQLMLATAGGMGFTLFVTGVLWARKREFPMGRNYLRLVLLTGPLGIIGIEAGWTATEVGRQPWVISGVMRTADAVTPMPGLTVPFLVFSALYLVLLVLTVILLRRQFLVHDAA
jgi:cytochrome d ubiquinol oxidase subunit I